MKKQRNSSVELTESTKEMLNVYRDAVDNLYRMEEIYLSQFVRTSGTCDEIYQACEILGDFLAEYLIGSLAENDFETI